MIFSIFLYGKLKHFYFYEFQPYIWLTLFSKIFCCPAFNHYLICSLCLAGELRPALQIAATDIPITRCPQLSEPLPFDENANECRLLLVGPTPCGVCALGVCPREGAQVGEQVGEQSDAPSCTPSAKLAHIYAGNADYDQIGVLLVRVFASPCHSLPLCA